MPRRSRNRYTLPDLVYTPGAQKPAAPAPTSGAVGYRKRALASALHIAQEFRVDMNAHEVLQSPSNWVTGTTYYCGNVVVGTSGGNTTSYYLFRGVVAVDGSFNTTCSSNGVSNNEPVRDSTNKYKLIRTADGCMWQPLDASAFPVSKRPSVLGAGGVPVTPILTTDFTYNAAPVDGSAVALIRRYQSRDVNGYITNEPTLGTNRAAFANLFFAPGQFYWAPSDLKGQIRNYSTNGAGDSTNNGATTTGKYLVAFKTGAKSVCISIARPDDGKNVNGAKVPMANIWVDGVATGVSHVQTATFDGSARSDRYTYNFPDARLRVFWVTTSIDAARAGQYVDGVWTSAEDTILAATPPALVLGFGDSTFDGATPGPFDCNNTNYGSCIGWNLGLTSSIQMGQGGTGFIHSPKTTTPNLTNQTLNFIDRTYANQSALDTRQGAAKISLIVIDVPLWDTPDSNPLYTSNYRLPRFTAWLTDLALWQPDAVFVFVEPRHNVGIKRDGSKQNKIAIYDVNGTEVVDAASTINARSQANDLVADWKSVATSVLTDDQLVWVTLADFADNINNFTAQVWYGVATNDYVHPVHYYLGLKGKYVAQKILQAVVAT